MKLIMEEWFFPGYGSFWGAHEDLFSKCTINWGTLLLSTPDFSLWFIFNIIHWCCWSVMRSFGSYLRKQEWACNITKMLVSSSYLSKVSVLGWLDFLFPLHHLQQSKNNSLYSWPKGSQGGTMNNIKQEKSQNPTSWKYWWLPLLSAELAKAELFVCLCIAGHLIFS